MLYGEVTERILGCAIEVHRQLGPGLLESLYLTAMCTELTHNRVSWKRENAFPVFYRGAKIGEFRPDLIIEDLVVVEIKSVARHDPLFEAQILTYLRITKLRLGLLVNFNKPVLKDGIKRFIL